MKKAKMLRANPQTVSNTLFDLIVIGGGVTGSATARDAALRGLSVLLLEKDDFASGTSSRSSKLIHGGLRYLETYQFKLVAESLRERERAIKLAPHLTEVRPFLYLLYNGYPEPKWLLNLGLTFYDVASGEWLKRRHKMLNPKKVLELEPHLNAQGLKGAGMYYDVFTDDARFTLDNAKGAAEAGAVLMNHAEVTGLILENGKARGVTVRDSLTGEEFEAHGHQILNATGPWTDRTRSFEHTKSTHELRPTKGVHIVVKKRDFPLNTAVFLRSPDDNRVVWPTPSLEEDVVYIGTTDTDYTGDPDDVHPDESDVTYLLNVANHTIPEAKLDESHIVGSWAGLRPLVAPAPGTTTSNTSREHEISVGPTGLLTISGGKLTSSRLMAKQFVNAAEEALGRKKTKGGAATTALPGSRVSELPHISWACARAGVPDVVAKAWIRRYGSNAAKLLEIWKANPASRREFGVRGLSVAEIEYLVAEEMVGRLDDLMVRRTGIFFWDDDGGLEHIDEITNVLGDLLRWDPQRREQEMATYRDLVEKHRPAHKE